MYIMYAFSRQGIKYYLIRYYVYVCIPSRNQTIHNISYAPFAFYIKRCPLGVITLFCFYR